MNLLKEACNIAGKHFGHVLLQKLYYVNELLAGWGLYGRVVIIREVLSPCPRPPKEIMSMGRWSSLPQAWFDFMFSCAVKDLEEASLRASLCSNLWGVSLRRCGRLQLLVCHAAGFYFKISNPVSWAPEGYLMITAATEFKINVSIQVQKAVTTQTHTHTFA